MLKPKIFLFGLILLMTLACGLSPQTDVFETDTFSFSIPEDWKWGGGEIELFGSSFQQVVGIRNPQGLFPSANFTVLTSPLDDESSLETRLSQTYKEVGQLGETSTQEVEVDGLTGYEIIYTNNVGEALFVYQDIWVENDQIIYLLSFGSLGNSKEDYTSIFAQILDSFRFKD
jgi:hypothetical protein